MEVGSVGLQPSPLTSVLSPKPTLLCFKGVNYAELPEQPQELVFFQLNQGPGRLNTPPLKAAPERGN